jgi:glycosyltransferase involved in cell wall biosynthesis
MAATLHAAKGIAAVVDAFSSPEIAVRHDEWQLHFVGDGDRGLLAPLLSSPSVRHDGAFTPDDLPTLLAGADVGISASVFETFHRVTREYLSAGLAVLGSTAFGITDVVVDGANGLLFDHAEPGSLRRAVVRLLDDRDLVAWLRTGARSTQIRTVGEEVDDLEAVYADLSTVP